MKIWWEKQSARINGLSLRERVFLFLSLIACCLALVDTLWLSPAQVAHKQLIQRFEKQNADLRLAREALKTVGTPADTNKTARDELAAVKTRLEQVNHSIKEALPATTQGTPLVQVLSLLLRRHEGLTLVRTSTLMPEVPVIASQTPSAAAVALPAGFTRQGVELTVSGSYGELTQYVQALETELPYVHWGVMTLKSDQLPPELTLQLYLLGVQP
jgi:MSHA biogenesis protein MshJ